MKAYPRFYMYAEPNSLVTYQSQKCFELQL
jgi:hypothetical protein